MSDELEPLDSRSAALLGALPRPALPPELKAKLWSRVEASAMAMPPVPAAPQPVSAPPVAKAAATGAAAKLVVPSVIAALIAGGAGGVALDRAIRKPEVEVRYVEVPAKPVEPPKVVEPPPAPVESPPTPAPLPVVLKPKPPPVESPSAGERQLLEMTRTALVKHDAAAALDAVAQHRKRFPKGQLAEERDALEVQALAIAGRADDAKAAAKAFLARYPGSVFEDAVNAALSR